LKNKRDWSKIKLIDSEELKEFVSSTISSIEKGLTGHGGKYYLRGSIKFEIAIVNVKKDGAGLKLYVVDASRKINKENVSKITFEVAKRPESLDASFG
jgi:hypothetical protein